MAISKPVIAPEYRSTNPGEALESGYTLTIRGKQALAFDARKGLLITVCCGEIWLTLEGDAFDHILKSGDFLIVTHRGRMVVESLYSNGAICQLSGCVSDPA
ncbi:MAG: DUF2917 domain-containing protein [Candidatus Sumerlaeia bacterium]|nr:DUF2917 domain-containing protein [Candidatus Sumerlaeia bacterium]